MLEIQPEFNSNKRENYISWNPTEASKEWKWRDSWSVILYHNFFLMMMSNYLIVLNALVRANTFFQQRKRRLYTWTSPDGQHWNQIYYILCSQRWRSSIKSAKTRPGADCGLDHELLIAKFRLKLKKVGKTTRPFRYDLNQIPYDYAVEVRNRYKELDLIDTVLDELWIEVRDIVQETGITTIPMEKKCKKAKWLSEEALK